MRAHLRTWYRGRDGCWRPTRRGVTVPPEQLEQLEAAVRALREAYAAGALGLASASAPTGGDSEPRIASDATAKPDTLPTA